MTTWWGTLAFCVLEGTGFALAAAAYLFLWVNNPDWPIETGPPGLLWSSLALLVMLASLWPNLLATRSARSEDLPRVRRDLVVLSAIGLAAPRAARVRVHARSASPGTATPTARSSGCCSGCTPRTSSPISATRIVLTVADVHPAWARQALLRRRGQRLLLELRRARLGVPLRPALLGAPAVSPAARARRSLAAAAGLSTGAAPFNIMHWYIARDMRTRSMSTPASRRRRRRGPGRRRWRARRPRRRRARAPGCGAGGGSAPARGSAPMISGSIAEWARPASSACGGVFQSSVSKAPQFSQTGAQAACTWLHLPQIHCGPREAPSALASQPRTTASGAPWPRSIAAMIARLRVVGSVSARSPSALRAAGEVLGGERELGGEQAALGVVGRWRRSASRSACAGPPGSRRARSRRRRRRGRDAGWRAQAAVSALVALRLAPFAACTRAASAAAGTSVGASRFACSAASLPRAVSPAASAARASASDSTASRRVPTSRGSRRACIEAFSVSRAPGPVLLLRLQLEERAQHPRVVGPAARRPSWRAPARCRCRPRRASAASAPAPPTNRVRSFGSIAL